MFSGSLYRFSEIKLAGGELVGKNDNPRGGRDGERKAEMPELPGGALDPD